MQRKMRIARRHYCTMGINGFVKRFAKKAPNGIRKIQFSEMRGQRCAIDTSCFVYKAVYNAGSNNTSGAHIKTFVDMVLDLYKHRVTPIFIFDGKAPEEKGTTLQARRDKRDSNKRKVATIQDKIAQVIVGDAYDSDKSYDIEDLLSNYGDLSKEQNEIISKLRQEEMRVTKNTICINRDIYADIENVLKLMGVEYYNAREEADFLCAQLCSNGDVDFVISNDTDMLTHGAPVVIKDYMSMNYRRKGEVQLLDLENILTDVDITMSQFVDICVLSGCDYNNKQQLTGVGRDGLIRLIKKHGRAEDLPGTFDLERVNYDQSFDLFAGSRDRDNIMKHSKSRLDKHKLASFLTNKTTFRKSTIERKLSQLSSLEHELHLPL